MNIKDVGELPIDLCNEMNIPVNCLLSQREDDDDDDLYKSLSENEKPQDYPWVWRAENFMPRKSSVDSGYVYVVYGKTKQDLIDVVNKYVVPLYQAALNNLTILGENYYWEENKNESL